MADQSDDGDITMHPHESEHIDSTKDDIEKTTKPEAKKGPQFDINSSPGRDTPHAIPIINEHINDEKTGDQEANDVPALSSANREQVIKEILEMQNEAQILQERLDKATKQQEELNQENGVLLTYIQNMMVAKNGTGNTGASGTPVGGGVGGPGGGVTGIEPKK